MSYRSRLLWQVPLGDFQAFDKGQIISDLVQQDWELCVGDQLEYEAGMNIAGVAEVVSVGTETFDMFPYADDHDDDLIPVMGVRCAFRKVN